MWILKQSVYCRKCEGKSTVHKQKDICIEHSLNHWLFLQTSMNVKLEHITVADMLYVPTRQEASNAAAVLGGLEMGLSVLVS